MADKLDLARGLVARGERAEAEKVFREIVAADSTNREALEQLVILGLQRADPVAAEDFLRQLVRGFPTEPLYCDRLATLLERRGRGADAIACYRALLSARPALVNSRYNLARLLKREGHPQDALDEYRLCLARKIERPEEVLSNIGVIHTELHQHDQARQSLLAALKLAPDYIPALYNLALLQEEEGDWPAAGSTYHQILQLDPLHAGALAHIANAEQVTGHGNPIIGQLHNALGRDKLPDEAREELLYALGKTHDDCRQFDEAFDYYRQANALGQKRSGSYDKLTQERLVDQLISHCDNSWISSVTPVSDAPLVFICGMFRSGTTLLEQILAAHPALTPGGEIDFFQRALKPFPSAILTADGARLRHVGQAYTEYLAQHFPAGARVTNKRPDNFFCLGLLKALFPQARFINTQRQPLDNCLSLYFQPLEAAQSHANDLLDAGHYYLQHRRVLAHWQHLLGDAILEVSYESLVDNPRQTITRALAFLELEWSEDCLAFHRAHNRVRTASVHQVRRPLYDSSSGRWRNYAAHVEELRGFLDRYDS